MKKFLTSVTCALMLIIIVLNCFTAFCYADNENFNLDKYGSDAQATGTNSSSITDPVKKIGGAILAIVRIVGTGIALIMITVIAIKYLLAAPGERADIKKSSIQYVIGAVIVFGSVNIMDLLVKVLPKLVSD